MSGDSFSRQPPRIVGRYAVGDAIAAGGMATVHLGRLVGPVGFSRTVAIKRLHPQFALDEEFVGMFLDEARLVGRIRHPNVIPTLDVVSIPGELFLVMDYVPGESLSKLLKGAAGQGQRFPPRILAAILAATLHGLHAAHEARDEHGEPLGIVHRDVSPQNVLVGTDGVPRILDFGVAKAAGRVQTTQAGQLKGKLAYMAPEQIRADVVNRQTDVYAASIVLWESLVGRRLYDASNEGALLAKVMEANAAPPSTEALAATGPLDEEGRHDLGHLDAIVMRGLAKDPARRFATAREMALALESRLRPATAAEIAAWVEMAAAPALAKRAQLVATLEREEALSRARGSFADLGAYGGSIPPGAAGAPGAPPVPATSSHPAGPGSTSAAPSELSAVSRISGASQLSQLSQLSKVAFTAGSGAPPPRDTSRSPVLVVLGSTLLGIAVAAGLLAIFFGRPAPGGASRGPAGSAVPSAASATASTSMSASTVPVAPATPSVSAVPDAPAAIPMPLPQVVPTGNADAGASSGGAAASEPATPSTTHHHRHHHPTAPAAETAP